MKKNHLYLIAAVGAFLYWKSHKAKTAAANNAAPIM